MRLKNLACLIVAVLCVASSTALADMLTNAQNFLAWQGTTIPAGWNVRWGGDTAGGAAGEAKPNDPGNLAAGGEIVINPQGIKRLAPSLTGDVTQFGGVIVTVLYHEIQHANGSFGAGICDEIPLHKQTAEQACNLVCLILSELPGANVNPLCNFSKDTRTRYNVGVSSAGGAPAAWASHCPGSFPGLIPSCPCCP